MKGASSVGGGLAWDQLSEPDQGLEGISRGATLEPQQGVGFHTVIPTDAGIRVQVEG